MKHFIGASVTNEPDNIGVNFSKEEGHSTASTKRFGSDPSGCRMSQRRPGVVCQGSSAPRLVLHCKHWCCWCSCGAPVDLEALCQMGLSLVPAGQELEPVVADVAEVPWVA